MAGKLYYIANYVSIISNFGVTCIKIIAVSFIFNKLWNFTLYFDKVVSECGFSRAAPSPQFQLAGQKLSSFYSRYDEVDIQFVSRITSFGTASSLAMSIQKKNNKTKILLFLSHIL